ncbi:MAG: ROK family protein [Spirochaetaceae bacterium]|jgi:predicted NBD/HSP70 family sugar kinase|nr:ROK family protein [Spirochaetaceae bacterium]
MKKTKTSNLDIQKINRTNVYQLLRQGQSLTKQSIVHQLGLSLPTIVNNITTLQGEGLIKEEGIVGHTGGRRAKTWTIVKDARIAIGLDVTRDYVIAVAVDLAGEIIYRTQKWCKFTRSDAYYKKLGILVENVVKNVTLDKKCILGVGIGVPGLVTEDRETVFYGEILKFTGITRAEFSKYIPYKTALFNDASAAGFGEFWIHGKSGSAFYVSLSNNIGGAVMIENRILNGHHYHTGEIGHLTLHPGGKRCYCGQSGCVDPYLAATVLSDLTCGNLSAFFKLLEENNKNAVSLWDTYLDDLAMAVNNVQQLFDCTVILGGYIAEYIEKYMPELKKRAAALNSFEHDADYLDICRYKIWSIAAGAALTFSSDFIDSI